MASGKTKEDRAREKAALEAQRAAEHDSYVAALPMRLLLLQAQCAELGVEAKVRSHKGFPVVEFYHESFDGIVIVTGPEPSAVWEMDNLEADFRAIRELREQENRKRELAKAVRSKLTPEELHALFRYPQG